MTVEEDILKTVIRRRTWTTLNLEYPSHKIPFATIRDLIDSCPTCRIIEILVRIIEICVHSYLLSY